MASLKFRVGDYVKSDHSPTKVFKVKDAAENMLTLNGARNIYVCESMTIVEPLVHLFENEIKPASPLETIRLRNKQSSDNM